MDNLLRNEPIEYTVKERAKPKKVEKDPFAEDNEEESNNDEGEWIGLENIEEKLNDKIKSDKKVEDTQLKVYLTTADFTVQNVALKIGIPVQSIDGMRIRKIKNYLLKCYACETFNWDTTRLFCEHCGYNTLMKIGYSVSAEGKVSVNDKKADARLRGTQVITI
jgi:RNA-binding protein NOB1